MRRRRWSKARWTVVWATIFGLGTFGVFATTGSAEVPTSIDAYGGSAYASAIHVTVGTNAFPNFAGGAVDNRYPLVLVAQDVSPASQASSSVDDYGPLGATLITTDCSKPPAPLPNPNPKAPPNYCLAGVRDIAPYSRAQFPNPPGKPDDRTVFPPATSNVPAALVGQIGFATAHAEELKADAFGQYSGLGNEATAPAVQNLTAEAHTKVLPDGTLDVTTHSHVARAIFAGVLDISNVDVVTEVKSLGGKAVVTESISPGVVKVNGSTIKVDDHGVTIPNPQQPTGNVNAPATGGAQLGTPSFFIRTLHPNQLVNGNHGTVNAVGLEVTVMNEGLPSKGIESSSATYDLGEGGADGFATPASLIPEINSNSGLVAGAVQDVLGSSSYPGYTGSAPSTLTTRTKVVPGKNRRLVAASVLARLPLPWLFYIWEVVVFAAAATSVYSRRRRLAEDLE
jgi:hypothetical protein